MAGNPCCPDIPACDLQSGPLAGPNLPRRELRNAANRTDHKPRHRERCRRLAISVASLSDGFGEAGGRQEVATASSRPRHDGAGPRSAAVRRPHDNAVQVRLFHGRGGAERLRQRSERTARERRAAVLAAPQTEALTPDPDGMPRARRANDPESLSGPRKPAPPA